MPKKLTGVKAPFIPQGSPKSFFGSANRTSYTDQIQIDYSIPSSYYEKVKRIRTHYKRDPLFRFLIDRTIQFATTQSEFEIGIEDTSFWQKLKDKITRKEKQRRNEEDVWNLWPTKINAIIPLVPNGLIHVQRWFYKHLLLDGMVVPEFKWNKIQLGRKEYKLPTQITVHKPTTIQILQKNEYFGSEQLIKNVGRITKRTLDKDGNIHTEQSTQDKYETIHPIGQSKNDLEGCCIRFNWTPGDLSDADLGIKKSNSADNNYPDIPFIDLLPVLILREALFASDLSILNGVIEYLMLWKLGDKDNPPEPAKRDPTSGQVIQGKEGDIYWFKKAIEGQLANVMQLFVDYRVNLEIKTPPVETLINRDKYIPSTVEILHRFGIFGLLEQADDEVWEFNIANFEELLKDLRMLWIGFVDLLKGEILKRNPELTNEPRHVMSPVNTQTTEFKNALLQLRKLGQISWESTLKGFNLSDKVEQTRIARELSTGIKEMLDETSPIQFAQRTVDPSGKVTENKDKSPKRGRPKEKLEKE